MNSITSYTAIHSSVDGAYLIQTNCLSEARHYLVDRIQTGQCTSRDAMAIVGCHDHIVYARFTHNTVESVLGWVNQRVTPFTLLRTQLKTCLRRLSVQLPLVSR